MISCTINYYWRELATLFEDAGYFFKNIFLTSDVTSNECIAGNGYIPDRSVIQVSTQKNGIKVQYLYDNNME